MSGAAERWLARKSPPRSWAELEPQPFLLTRRVVRGTRTLVGMPRPPLPNLARQASLYGMRVMVQPARAVSP